MEVHRVEDAKGKLLKIGFNRSGPKEDFRTEIKEWMERNYPEMTPIEFLNRLDSLNNDFWVISMEDRRG